MAEIYRLPQVERARKRAAKPEPVARQWVCRVCEAEIGIATSTLIVLVNGARIKGLKVEGGTKQHACAYCWKRGRLTVVP